MSRKSNKSTMPPTIITLTLPDGNELIRSGTLLIQRGDLAAIRQFSYSGLSGITLAIQEAAAQFIEIEADPPPAFNVPTTPVSAVASPEPEPTQPESESQPGDAEVTEETQTDAGIQSPDDSQPITLSLF